MVMVVSGATGMTGEEPGTTVVMAGETGELMTGTTVVEATIVEVLRRVEFWIVTVATEVAKMVQVVSFCEVMSVDLRDVMLVLQGTSYTHVVVAGTV